MDELPNLRPRWERHETNPGLTLPLVPWPAMLAVSTVTTLDAAGRMESLPYGSVCENFDSDVKRKEFGAPLQGRLRAQPQRISAPDRMALRVAPGQFATPAEPAPKQEPPTRRNAETPSDERELPAQPERASTSASRTAKPADRASSKTAEGWRKIAAGASKGRYPASVRAIAEQMLIEGASPEEVVKAAHERGFTRLKRDTVQRWLDESPELSEQTLRRQAETAVALRQSLATDLGSPEARLAEALLFAGLARPRTLEPVAAGTVATLGIVWRKQLESENRILRRQAERLRQRNRSISRRIVRARLRLERMRWKLLERQVSRFGASAAEDTGDDFLVPELLIELRKLRRATAERKKGHRRGEK